MTMRIRTIPTAALLAVLFVLLSVAVSTAAADDRRHGHYGGHSGGHYDSFAWGLSLGYPSPYWGGYGPGYPPGLSGSIGLGYNSWGHHDNWGLALSLPLYFGPRYAPPPAPVLVPAPQAASRQLPAGCLQVREYQSEIVIDGQPVPAWGQACLQADGSWKILNGPFTE